MTSTPYSKTISELAPEGAYKKFRSQTGRYCTGNDRKKPQPYVLLDGEVLSWRKWKASGNDYNPKNPTSRSAHNPLPFQPGGLPVRNKAYEKFKESIVLDEAAIGVALTEASESFGMIQKRAMSLYRSYKKLRKGDFRGALKELSVSPKRKHKNLIRNGAHEASGLWLEYWFGWSPFLSDIDTAARQLSEPVPCRQRYKGRSTTRVSVKSPSQAVTGKFSVETGALVTLRDPNQFLASQLGLTNPALILWERVPFSFLADWCFDVSSFIGSYSDFRGLELTEKYTTEVLKCLWTLSPASTQTGTYAAKQVFMERRLELVRPLPNLDVLANLGVSKTRAASAVSLLTQILRV